MQNYPWNQPYYYEDLVTYGMYLQEKYPSFLKYEILGYSYDRRIIFGLNIGKGSKKLLLTAGVHGRESINPFSLMKMLEYYLEKKQDWLNEYSIYAIPLLNPDGYMIALRGFHMIQNEQIRLKIKQMNIPYVEWKYNGMGQDINRDFPAKSWRKKHDNDTMGSQIETKILMRVMNEVETEGYMDYHSRGKCIYYYRNSMSEWYNRRQLKIAKALCQGSMYSYTLVPKEEEVVSTDSGGNTVHYYSELLKKPAITIETIEEEAEFPFDFRYQEEVFYDIVDTPKNMMQTLEKIKRKE